MFNRKGFTLIELLICIVIIGIVIAVLVVPLVGWLTTGDDKKVDAPSIQTEAPTYQAVKAPDGSIVDIDSSIPLGQIEGWICYYPAGSEVISSEFSTGGGDKTIMILEVDVRYEDGTTIKYLDQIISSGSMLGMSRLAIPNSIKFIHWNKHAIKVVK